MAPSKKTIIAISVPLAVIVLGVAVTLIVLFTTGGGGDDPGLTCESDVDCGSGYKCSDAQICIQCDDELCGGLACCGENQSCIEGQCCNNPCGDSCCSYGQDCVDGVCCNACGDEGCCGFKETCLVGECCPDSKVCAEGCCDSDEMCSDTGICVDCSGDLCGGTDCCGLNQTCDDGECKDVCGTVVCDSDEMCVDDDCCPQENVCDDGSCCEGGCCGDRCCPDGESCVGDVCCPSTNVCDDGLCCQDECCGGVCCSAGETCVNGECKVACCASESSCDLYCTPGVEECNVVDSGEDDAQYFCSTLGCEFTSTGAVYDPSNFKTSAGASKATVDVCEVCDGDDCKFYYCHNPEDVEADTLTRSATATQSSSSQAECGISDCDYIFATDSVDHVAWDSSKKECSGEFDCGTLPACGDCPVDDVGRCCTDSDGNYTGQICPTGLPLCQDGACYAGWACGDSGEWPSCELTTDLKEVTAASESDCMSSGCIVQSAASYVPFMKSLTTSNGKTVTEESKYMLVAFYGYDVSIVSDSDLNNEGTKVGYDGFPTIWVMKSSKADSNPWVNYEITDHYSGETYQIHINAGGSDSKSDTLTGKPTVSYIQSCSAPGTCDGDKVDADTVLDVVTYERGSQDWSGDDSDLSDKHAFPATVIIVPKQYVPTN